MVTNLNYRAGAFFAFGSGLVCIILRSLGRLTTDDPVELVKGVSAIRECGVRYGVRVFLREGEFDISLECGGAITDGSVAVVRGRASPIPLKRGTGDDETKAIAVAPDIG